MTRYVRNDLSSKLIHLTRGKTDEEAISAFLSILRERTIRGGSEKIRGGYRCVCFSEAPIGQFAQFFATDTANKMRYKPFGIMVDKEWFFELGGRPVIYQPDCDFTLLPEQLRYLHVRYEPPKVDFTWEREWRILTSELKIDPAVVTVICPNRTWEDKVRSKQEKHVGGMAMVAPLGAYRTANRGLNPWHWIALSDLGVHVSDIVATDEQIGEFWDTPNKGTV